MGARGGAFKAAVGVPGRAWASRQAAQVPQWGQVVLAEAAGEVAALSSDAAMLSAAGWQGMGASLCATGAAAMRHAAQADWLGRLRQSMRQTMKRSMVAVYSQASGQGA